MQLNTLVDKQMSSHMDQRLPFIVEAYDIDGTLTRESGRELLLDAADMKRTAVGIVTARDEEGLQDFLDDNPEIDKAVEFAKSRKLKFIALNQVRSQYPNADEYIYHGSRPRDRVATLSYGWDFNNVIM